MDNEAVLFINLVCSSFGQSFKSIDTYADTFEALRVIDESAKANELFRFDLLSKLYEITYIDCRYRDIDRGKLMLKINFQELSIHRIALILDALETVMNSEEYKSAS